MHYATTTGVPTPTTSQLPLPAYPSLAAAVSGATGPPVQLDLGDVQIARIYAVYQPSELICVAYSRWETLRGLDPRLRAKGVDPVDRTHELAARQWLANYRHSTGSVGALVLPDLP